MCIASSLHAAAACFCVRCSQLAPCEYRYIITTATPPQVAGLRFWHRGGKLLAAKRLLPDGSTAPLDDATSYNVASTTYLFSGGDGYSMFAKARARLLWCWGSHIENGTGLLS